MTFTIISFEQSNYGNVAISNYIIIYSSLLHFNSLKSKSLSFFIYPQLNGCKSNLPLTYPYYMSPCDCSQSHSSVIVNYFACEDITINRKKRFPLSHGETYKCTRTTTDKTRHIDIHIHIVINIQIHVQQHTDRKSV